MTSDSAGPERSPLERWAPLAAGVLIALPTLFARYLPMSDLPMHEGVVGLLRHFGDPKYMPEGLYYRDFGHPNQLFHVVSWLLSYVVSTSAAVRIVVAASQIAIFLGGAHFADYMRRSRWGVLLLTPLALGFLFYWGMVANLIGIAALLFALPSLDRFSESPTLRSAARVFGILVFLYFAHETIFLTAIGILGLFALLQPLSLRDTALRIAPAACGFLGAVAQLVHQREFAEAVPIIPMTFLPFWQKIELLPNALFGSYQPIERAMLFFLALFATGLLARSLIGEIREQRRSADVATAGSPPSRVLRARAFLLRHRFALVGCLFALGYFILPFNWNAATLLHERALAPAWSILCILAAPSAEPRAVGRLVAAAVPIGVLALAWPQFADAHRLYSELDKIIEHIPYGASVTSVALDVPPARTRTYSGGTGSGRIVADRGGRVAISNTSSSISPVKIRREYRWSEQDFRMMVIGSRSLIPAHDLKRQEWIVGQSRDPGAKRLFTEALAPEAEFVAEHGEWMLFHSTLPQRPLMSAQELPPVGSETVIMRAFRILKKRDAERASSSQAQ